MRNSLREKQQPLHARLRFIETGTVLDVLLPMQTVWLGSKLGLMLGWFSVDVQDLSAIFRYKRYTFRQSSELCPR